MQHNGHLTAISRRTLSAPMRALYNRGLLVGRVLDYGCGRGQDAEILKGEHNKWVTKYDPYYFGQRPTGKFEVITCNFVLNVIPETVERALVICDIIELLQDGGVAYITVRDDRKRLNGWTSKKTWQGLIEMDLPIHAKKTGQYITYKITK